jgi:uncharacterized protein (TIGR00299 family) protein
MARALAVDASNGAAGDMFIGALVDLGAPLESAQSAVDAVYPGLVRFSAQKVDRAGTSATHIQVSELEANAPSRQWSEIEEKILSSDLSHQIKVRAHQIFDALAQIEAQVHGVPLNEVHFHEVGAADSIADVIGVAALLDSLNISEIYIGKIEVGSGKVKIEHGELDVPAPATAALLQGFHYTALLKGECLTPTGAAIINALSQQLSFDLAERKIGRGAGTRNPAGYPNVLCTSIIDNVEDSVQCTIETNIDDIDPRLIPVVIEKLMAAGARDAWVEPIMMKKNRPAFTLKVLCLSEQRDFLGRIIFQETTSIGYRTHAVEKIALERFFTKVSVQGAEVQVKISILDGLITQVSPEFDEVDAIANRNGLPTRVVLEEARMAAHEAGYSYGAEFSG